jgi:hypothetical protein
MTGAAIEKSPADHRRSVRHRSFLGAKLVYGDGAFTIDCIVKDVSDTGARIKLPEGQAVPDQVYLVELRSGIAYEARVTWKRHPEIGLEFVHQHGLAEASTPHLMILKRLWIEAQQRSGI